jgi:NADPH:quinone reductase
MKALVCSQFGSIDNLNFGEIDVPNCGKDEVLIRVAYCGVNFPDTLIVQGKYQFMPELPFVPGGEVSGKVLAYGKEVKGLAVGDQVLAAMGWGGFGELAVAKGSNVYKIPVDVALDHAAALLETYATAYYGLNDRGQLRAGETLVVFGAAGGTGTAAVQLGVQMGAQVIACVSSDEKAKFCLENGAHQVINYEKEDLKAALKKFGGANVIFDPVGGANAELGFRALKPNGRHLVVGFASGDMPALPWNLPLLKSASIVGVFWGYFWRNEPEANAQNVAVLLKWLQENKIKPVITNQYSLQNGKQALLDIVNRKAKGKIVLKA